MTQRQTVLRMLEQAGPEGVTNGQFVNVNILRYSARIKELRDAGHLIQKHRITDGTFRYTLVSRGSSSREADHPGPARPVGSGAQLHREPHNLNAHGEPPRDGSSPSPPDEAADSIAADPGQLFEVVEDGPTGPVNPYEWEAA